MTKNVLFFLLVAVANLASAQYCGNAGSAVCSSNNVLTSFGMSDYRTFPCVHDSVPYSEVIQLYFPDSVQLLGSSIAINSVTVDSIAGLPCGLCWSCDNANFLYAGGGRGCIRISGTTDDVHGAYQLQVYGRASTSLGTFPGSLDPLGFQFYLNVVGEHDACTPVDILDLHLPCQAPVASTDCHYHIELASTPITTCPFTSTTVSVTNLSPQNYYFYWEAYDTTFLPGRVDSVSSSFTIYHSDIFTMLYVADTLGCIQTVELSNTDGGPLVSPTICYATTDSGQAAGTVRIVFERDNFFNNVARYDVYRQDTAWQLNINLIGTSSGAVGFVVDSFPASTGMNGYSIYAVPGCVIDRQGVGGNQYTRSVLTVDTFFAVGYPYLQWTNSNPLNYDQVYVFSRGSSGHWRLRYSSANVNSTGWTDLAPDSTHVEYMLGYRINSSCDPSRSQVTAFSNFAGADVTPDKVVPDTAAHTPTNPTTSIASTAADRILMYPNPATDMLHIQLYESGNTEIHIYDMESRLMVSKIMTGDTVSDINVANLALGVYTVGLSQNGSEIGRKRFVKQ